MIGVTWTNNPSVNKKNLSWSEENKIRGEVMFKEMEEGVSVTIDLHGFEPNTIHGFHVHEKSFKNANEMASVENCCDLLSGHFNPHGTHHGSIWNSDPSDRHVGDLCNNIMANGDGIVQLNYIDDMVSLNKKDDNYIGDRSLVIHKYPDDMGRQGFEGHTYKTMSDEIIRWYGRVDKNGNVRDKNELMKKSLIDGNAGFRIGCGNLRGL